MTGPARSRLAAAIDRASKATALLGGLAILPMTVLITFDVLMRYFLNQPQLFVAGKRGHSTFSPELCIPSPEFLKRS